MLPVANPTHAKSWKKLQHHYTKLYPTQMRVLFADDPKRFERFSISTGPLFLDYSKNRITEETCTLLCELAEELHVPTAREALWSGKHINTTEDRAVLHQALRAPPSQRFYVEGTDLGIQIKAEKEKMRRFSEALHSGTLRGFSGKPINTLVNIGIGGSDLGPRMVCAALRPFRKESLKVHFVSNVDAADILDTLDLCNPERTFFLVASKTFRTEETMTNAKVARGWLLQAAQNKSHIGAHFAALSATTEEARAFGVPEQHIFRFWDWVGGRFSLWSSIGLSIACALGFEYYEELLEGAYSMDKHFLEAPLSKNMPVVLALLGLWYRNFFGARSYAVLCYAAYLKYFVPFLQQMAMESNGKAVDRTGKPIAYATAPVIWGEPGTNGQHSFHQLLHQGTDLIPCDFILPLQPEHRLYKQHSALLSHGFAQSRSLMWGSTATEIRAQLQNKKYSEEAIARSLSYRVCPGNRPSNTILLERLNPKTLGALIALYEHKVFVEGILWNIYSFDQWGVELGKEVATHLSPVLQDPVPSHAWDASTAGLIAHTRQYAKHIFA